MNLFWKYLENPFPLSTATPNTFVIEHPDALFSFLQALDALNGGAPSEVSVLTFSTPVSLKERVEIVLDFLQLSLNNKKILSAITKRITAEATDMLHLFSKFHTEGIRFLSPLVQDFLTPLTFDDFSFSTLLKAFPLTVSEDSSSLIQKLSTYVDAYIEFCKTEYFVFLNLRDFLSKEHFVQFQKHCAYRQIYFLNIQSHPTDYALDENIILIDQDLCQVLETFSTLC